MQIKDLIGDTYGWCSSFYIKYQEEETEDVEMTEQPVEYSAFEEVTVDQEFQEKQKAEREAKQKAKLSNSVYRRMKHF